MQVTREDIYNAIDQKVIVQLTNDEPSGSTIVESKVDEALEFANGFIDDALRGNYILPLPVMPVLKEIGINVAIYKLYQLRHRHKMPEGISEAYKNSATLLNEYATGKKHLDIVADEAKPSNIRAASRPRSFTPEILSRY